MTKQVLYGIYGLLGAATILTLLILAFGPQKGPGYATLFFACCILTASGFGSLRTSCLVMLYAFVACIISGIITWVSLIPN